MIDQSDGDLASGAALGRLDLPGEDEESVTVRAELSTVLEESVESLSAAVGGWSSELARSSERASRLEATIASLSAAMETWKTDMARSSARAEERLLRALEILESRMAQHQAIVGEIRESQGSSAAWLTRAMEEWKAEIRYGSGLTEVRLLSAVESLENKVGQIQEAGAQTREMLNNATADLGRNLEARVSTVKAVQDETREWLEAAATAVGNDAQSALSRLRDLIGTVESLKGELRQQTADSEALAADSRAQVIGRINEVVTGLSEARSAGVADRLDLRRELNSLKESLNGEISDVTTATTMGLADLRDSLGSQIATSGKSVDEKLASTRSALEEVIAKGISQAQAAALTSVDALKSTVEEWKAAVSAATVDSETRLLRGLESIEGGVLEAKSLGSGVQQQVKEALESLTAALSVTDKAVAASADRTAEAVAASADRTAEAVAAYSGSTTEMVTKTLTDLDAKIGSMFETAQARIEAAVAGSAESGQSLGSMISALTGSVTEWHEAVGAATSNTESKLVRSLEALEASITAGRVDPQVVDESLHYKLDELEGRLARTEADNVQRGEKLEEAVNALTHSIDEWRAKGRQAADRSKERLAQSLEALENRLLEAREDEADYQDSMSKELAALTDAVDGLSEGSRDTSTVMRGLEELDEGIMRNRDEVAHLADTFEAQFEIFEARIGDKVAARLDELEQRIQERNKALVTLLLPKGDTSSLIGPTEVEPPRRTVEPSRTTVDRPGQARRRR